MSNSVSDPKSKQKKKKKKKERNTLTVDRNKLACSKRVQVNPPIYPPSPPQFIDLIVQKPVGITDVAR